MAFGRLLSSWYIFCGWRASCSIIRAVLPRKLTWTPTKNPHICKELSLPNHRFSGSMSHFFYPQTPTSTEKNLGNPNPCRTKVYPWHKPKNPPWGTNFGVFFKHRDPPNYGNLRVKPLPKALSLKRWPY